MENSGYSDGAVAWATVGTVLLPFVAFVAALVLLGSQADPRKRSQLRRWAWISGVWLVLATGLAVLFAFV